MIETGPIQVQPFNRPGGTSTSVPGTQAPATTPAPTPPQPTQRINPNGPWDTPQYKAARLKILDARKEFYYLVQGKVERGRLKKIEQDVREAIDELKKVQASAPAGVDVDRHITAGYKLISDCRQATRL